MSALEPQIELALSRMPNRASVPIEMIRAKKNAGAAFTLACDASGLEDKEISIPLGIDAGYFSNIKKNKATLQGDKVADFCRIAGNTIYLEWLAWQVGGTITLLKTGLEMENEQLRAALAEERKKTETITEFMRTVRA